LPGISCRAKPMVLGGTRCSSPHSSVGCPIYSPSQHLQSELCMHQVQCGSAQALLSGQAHTRDLVKEFGVMLEWAVKLSGIEQRMDDSLQTGKERVEIQWLFHKRVAALPCQGRGRRWTPQRQSGGRSSALSRPTRHQAGSRRTL